MKTQNIGFIGLGNIGFPMARRLLNYGFRLTAYDLDQRHRATLTNLGAIWANNLEILCEHVDTVITSLPGPAEVREVFESEKGLLKHLHDGQTWIEMSTNDKTLIRDIGMQLNCKGVSVLEAPVTGGVANVSLGKITLFVAGKESIYSRTLPIFQALAEEIIYLGKLGNATVAKLITNMIAFVHEAILAESLILGVKAGVNPHCLLNAIQKSYAGSFVANLDGPRILSGDYDSSFAIKLALKDMSLTLELAQQLSNPLLFGTLVTELLKKTQKQYGPDADTLMSYKIQEDEQNCALQKK